MTTAMIASEPIDTAPISLAELNRMLPLPDPAEGFTAEDRHLALNARLRLWRSGPAQPDEVRAAVGAEIAEEIEHLGGTTSRSNDEIAQQIDRVAALLEGDATLADPPDGDEVAMLLHQLRAKFAQVHRPHGRTDHIRGIKPVPHPDTYGRWPGVFWRRATEYSLAWAIEGTDRPTTSGKVARRLLRDEAMAAAQATAEAEEAARQAAADRAAERLATVFDDGRQGLLAFAVRLHARGDIKVPVAAHPIAEAKLVVDLARYDLIGVGDEALADVAAELIRFAAAERSADDAPRGLIVPSVGYAIRLDEFGAMTDILPGLLRLEIGRRHHVLRCPRWPKTVRLSKRDFRDARRCAQAIYDQAGVEVDAARGYWRKWWPSLAAQLLAVATEIDDAIDVERWQAWLEALASRAPQRDAMPSDGSPYVSSDGKLLASKSWVVGHAIEAGLIDDAEAKDFARWLGTAHLNRRDDDGNQRKVLALPVKSPLVIGASFSAE